jgi:hypothetical protein
VLLDAEAELSERTKGATRWRREVCQMVYYTVIVTFQNGTEKRYVVSEPVGKEIIKQIEQDLVKIHVVIGNEAFTLERTHAVGVVGVHVSPPVEV